METNALFVKQFQNSFGKPFEIRTGRNAYTFEKEQHAHMLAGDGTYLLLENPPQDNLKYRYDKALYIPAKVVDKFFPTNDPSKVKVSFHLGADKMRFEFNKQMYKLYQSTPCIIRDVPFKDTRRTYRIDRSEYEFLLKNGGEFIFAFTVGKKPQYLVEVVTIPAKEIKGFFPYDMNTSKPQKSVSLHFELSAITLKLLNDLGMRKLLTDEKKVLPKGVIKLEDPDDPLLSDGSVGNKVVEQYLGAGLPIKIVFPEGEHELVLECTITKQVRRIKEE